MTSSSLAKMIQPSVAIKQVEDILARAGLHVTRQQGGRPWSLRITPATGTDDRTSVPADELRADDPLLLDLQARYAREQTPLSAHSLWKQRYLDRDLRLRYFRGDNVYVWQRRRGEDRLTYYLYAKHLLDIDPRRLVEKLGEDGAFGCWVYRYSTIPDVSRDLLDSVNELTFLDRVWGIWTRPSFSVIDIGGGYGRLAHRMIQSVPSVSKYFCVDAVAESTYVCDWYLRHRGVFPTAESVPLDHIRDRLAGEQIDLAVAVHSLAEMSYASIEAWFALVAERGVKAIMIVLDTPNKMTSLEPDGSRRDYSGLLRQYGFELKADEPYISDPDVRELTGNTFRYLFFER